MKPIISSRHRRSLLNYAISKLNPEVFSHPAWIRFCRQEVSGSLELIDDLIRAVEKLEKDDASAACQILMVSAVYQTHAGQHHVALKTVQRALELSQHASLTNEAIWSLWGACAISFQQGDHEQTDSNLTDLQAALLNQNEWILADFVDVVRQSLFQPLIADLWKQSGTSRDLPHEDLLVSTFDWLRHWGFSAHTSHAEPGAISRHPVGHVPIYARLFQTFFSIQSWQARWWTLTQTIRAELRLQWARNDSPPVKRRFSFWGAILSSLRLFFHRGNVDTQAHDDQTQSPTVTLLPPVKQDPHPGMEKSRKKKVTKTPPSRKRQQSKRANNIVPVTVHMLGTFRITIGDVLVKIPFSRSLLLFKYLLIHHQQKVPREVLMDIFWPDAEPETARNSLNVAIHSLRQHLRILSNLPLIIFELGAYGLAHNLLVWIDVEEFERCVREGQRLEARNQVTAAVAEYETAISLYQGEFLEQNLYEEWTILDRERLRITYLNTLDRLSQIYFHQERYAACITVCQLILTRDQCREDAHGLLMRCYCRQGQYHLALRQYQIYAEALRTELDVEPGTEIMTLYERIQRREKL